MSDPNEPPNDPIAEEAPSAAPLPMPPGTGFALQPMAEPGTDELLCLHGPGGSCRHLWQFQTNYDVGNPEGTLDSRPRHSRRICLRGHDEMDLEGAAVYACNQFEVGAPKLVQLQLPEKLVFDDSAEEEEVTP